MTYPYPLSLMSNSTKAGEEETLWGLKVRGDVMDTRLIIWWMGIADPTGDSLRIPDFKRLKVRFSVFTGDPDEVSSSVPWPGGNNINKLKCVADFTSVFLLYLTSKSSSNRKQHLPFTLPTGALSTCDSMDALSTKHIRGSPKHRNFLRRKSNNHKSDIVLCVQIELKHTKSIWTTEAEHIWPEVWVCDGLGGEFLQDTCNR